MTIRPLTLAGAHSAAYTGTVADFGPMPIPRKNRAMKRCHQVFVTALQMQVMKAKKAVMPMVQRLFISRATCAHTSGHAHLPSHLLRGSVSQQAKTAEQRYGAPFTNPSSHASRSLPVTLELMPNWSG